MNKKIALAVIFIAQGCLAIGEPNDMKIIAWNKGQTSPMMKRFVLFNQAAQGQQNLMKYIVLSQRADAAKRGQETHPMRAFYLFPLFRKAQEALSAMKLLILGYSAQNYNF